MKALILEARIVKRPSKKVTTEYMPLAPGEAWFTSFEGQRISIISDRCNRVTLYVGERKGERT